MSCRRYLIPLMLLAFALLLPACGESDKGGTPKLVKNAPVNTDLPPQKVTAVDLGDQLRKDGKSTVGKYKLRLVEVTGIVLYTTPSHFARDFTAVYLLSVDPSKVTDTDKGKGKGKGKRTDFDLGPDGLKAGFDDNEVIRCLLPKEMMLLALSLVTGQEVTIRGKYRGDYIAEIYAAELVSKGSLPVKESTLAEVRKSLSKEDLGVLTPPTAPLVLTGTVKSIEAHKTRPGFYSLTAEDASAEPKLTVHLAVLVQDTAPAFADYVKGLKPGDAFRAHGQFRRSNDGWALVGTRQLTLLLPQK